MMNCSIKEMITLTTKKTQLSFAVLNTNHLSLIYFGERLSHDNFDYVVTEIQRASYLADTDSIKDFKLEQIPLAYPAYGNTDLRTPAHKEIYKNGSRVSDFRYVNHYFEKEKEKIEGLPFANNKNLTYLVICLRDDLTKAEIKIKLTAFYDDDVFTQSIEFSNTSPDKIVLTEIMSLNLDFLSADFDMLTLTGAWGRENKISRSKINQGTQGVDSKRGASGHGQNPFIALASQETTDFSGEVIACQLMYSGNFKASIEVDMHHNTRLQIGINPFEFSWELSSGESFQTPEAIFLFADGFNEMSQKFHQFYQKSVIRSQLKEQVRPILLNNWEATYFDFDKNIIYELADEAKKIGIELFVLDDGWFGSRDDDQSSLGDWFPNEKKLGGTLNSFINGIKNKGLDFGIWLEPEMISKNSLLYEKHPEWAIHIPERIPQQVRHQYVLDISRKEVQDYLINQIDNLLSNHEIDYVKWDMNRNITDAFSSELKNKNQQEFNHRYILGLYKILEVVTTKHPNVLFESCAGGGGRYDAGMLFYMPQTWTSDDTDAIARLSIQRGTTFIYPPVTMGCHVSATPNHQVGRITSLNTRALVAQQGNFGYELNLLELSDVEKIELAQQILTYKKERETLQFGVHSRLKVNNPDNEEAWQKYNQKTGELIVTHVTILAQPNTVPKRLKLVNLNKNQKYQVNGVIRQGDELMKIGLTIPKAKEDFFATKWVISKWEG